MFVEKKQSKCISIINTTPRLYGWGGGGLLGRKIGFVWQQTNKTKHEGHKTARAKPNKDEEVVREDQLNRAEDSGKWKTPELLLNMNWRKKRVSRRNTKLTEGEMRQRRQEVPVSKHGNYRTQNDRL